MHKIVFDTSLKSDILTCFDKEIKNGVIVEKETKESVLTEKGEAINKKEFAGIKKGSQIFFKNDIASLIEFANRK